MSSPVQQLDGGGLPLAVFVCSRARKTVPESWRRSSRSVSVRVLPEASWLSMYYPPEPMPRAWDRDHVQRSRRRGCRRHSAAPQSITGPDRDRGGAGEPGIGVLGVEPRCPGGLADDDEASLRHGVRGVFLWVCELRFPGCWAGAGRSVGSGPGVAAPKSRHPG